MLGLIGDIHGELQWLNHILKRVPLNVPVIQLGDYGLWPHVKNHAVDIYRQPSRKVHWFAGNHEYYPDIVGLTEVTEVQPNSFYIPNGLVINLGGLKIGVLGGADSIDRDWRTAGRDWFPEERITDVEVQRLYDNVTKAGGIDILLTHTPPVGITENMIMMEQGHSAKNSPEYNYCARYVQIVWEQLGRPPMWCGHMHPDRPFRALGVNCLPINWLEIISKKHLNKYAAK